jgi:hypothetical protein
MTRTRLLRVRRACDQRSVPLLHPSPSLIPLNTHHGEFGSDR